MPEENGAILTISSIETNTWLGQEFPRLNNRVYADLHRGAFMVKSLSPNQQVLKVIANADPKMKYVPKSLINFALRNICEMFLNLIERKS